MIKDNLIMTLTMFWFGVLITLNYFQLLGSTGGGLA